jgi:uncharacterized membrane protein YccC
LDLYVMIIPGVLPDWPLPGLLEVGLALGIGAACAWVLRDWMPRSAEFVKLLA